MNKRLYISLICFFTSLCLFFTNYVQAETRTSESSFNQKTEQSATMTEDSEEVESQLPTDLETTSVPTESVASRAQNYEESWAIVSTLSELQLALKNKEPYIKLAESSEVFVIGNAAATITADVVIDGNNRQISYYGEHGFNSTTAGITITLQNMTFGSPDFTVRAEGLYGIMRSAAKSELHITNVNYFSDKIAQPFYFRHSTGKIYFHGTNLFMQQKVDGSMGSGEEFAECNNFVFTAGSHTKIVQNTSGTIGLFWLPENPSSITLEEDAVLDVTSNHSFSYSDGTNNSRISLGKNSKLLVTGTNPDNGYFFYFDKPSFITVGEGAEFSMNYPRNIRIAGGSQIKFLPNSIGNFNVTHDETVFDRTVGQGSTFEIDNTKRLHFKAKAGSNFNPIGFASVSNTFSFNQFGADTNGYEIVTNEDTAPLKLTPQLDPGVWTILKDITRTVEPKTPDFTNEEKTILQNAESITLKRLNPPIELRKVDYEAGVNEATFNLAEYLLHDNDDLISGTEFKLYAQKSINPAAEGDGFIEQKQSDHLDESVAFSKLKEQTEYWLYVRIKADPDSQSSEWLEVPFKTTQEMLDINFPVEVAFYTEKGQNQQAVHAAAEYSIDNHSSFPVKLQATALQELSNPSGIQLLSQAVEGNQKDLFLNLTEQGQKLGVLTNSLHEAPLSFSDLAGKSSTKLGFSGIYYGDARTAQKVQYQLTLTAERKE